MPENTDQKQFETRVPISPENRMMMIVYVVTPIVSAVCYTASRVSAFSTEAIVLAGGLTLFAIGDKIMGPRVKLPPIPKYEGLPKQDKNQWKPWFRNSLILATSSVATIAIGPAIGAGAGLTAWYLTRNKVRTRK